MVRTIRLNCGMSGTTGPLECRSGEGRYDRGIAELAAVRLPAEARSLELRAAVYDLWITWDRNQYNVIDCLL